MKSLAVGPLFLAVVMWFISSCGRRQQVVSEGNFVASDSVTVLHWKEYLDRDSFFRDVTTGGVLVNRARSKSQEEFLDSTFSETDFFTTGKPKATRSFDRGVQNGVWNTWYDNGKTKSKSRIDQGLLRDYISYYDDGADAVSASRAPDGMLSRTERWRNGNLKEEFLTDSLGNGRCVNYHPNGRKSDSGGLYLFAPFDDWKRWDSLGKPLADTTYGHAVTH